MYLRYFLLSLGPPFTGLRFALISLGATSNKLSHLPLLLFTALYLTSCTPEQVIDVELPPYESQMMVECFLEPGKPYQLNLQESVSYFSDTIANPITDALVVITHAGVSDTLEDEFSYDPETEKFYTYSSDRIVPYAPGTTFELYIRDGKGREIRGSTTMLDTVSLAPLELDINAEGEASITARWQDTPGRESYYMLTMHKNQLSGRLVLDFLLDDRIGDGEEFVVSSWYWLDPGDSCIATVYHIQFDHWAYLNSIGEARGANGNPFAQPAVILSNVEGGIGVFTTNPLVRRRIAYP